MPPRNVRPGDTFSHQGRTAMVIRVGRDNRAVIEAVVVTTPGPEPRVITLSGHPEWSSERNAFVDSGAAA